MNVGTYTQDWERNRPNYATPPLLEKRPPRCPLLSKKGCYDKLLWGYGGPVLVDANVKIQRMPFITPEILASPAHTMPFELLDAIDKRTWERVRHAKRMRIVDPEGTDIEYTNHAGYYDLGRNY